MGCCRQSMNQQSEIQTIEFSPKLFMEPLSCNHIKGDVEEAGSPEKVDPFVSTSNGIGNNEKLKFKKNCSIEVKEYRIIDMHQVASPSRLAQRSPRNLNNKFIDML